MVNERLELTRLYWRCGFGPLPGQFAASLKSNFEVEKARLISPQDADIYVSEITTPDFSDMGDKPAAGTFEATAYSIKQREQNLGLPIWWMDRASLVDHGLREKLAWFWMGHWATSIEKINFARPMFLQYNTLYSMALENFDEMVHAMFDDGALQFWLDGQENIATAPNENLSREMMELFTLGVGNYTENDVQQLARAFTGYRVNRSSGEVTFAPKRHATGSVSLLGKTIPSDAHGSLDVILSQPAVNQFISRRLWFRLINSETTAPSGLVNKFPQHEITQLIAGITSSQYLSDPKNSMVKSPVEWLVGILRSLTLAPSQLKKSEVLVRYMKNLGQVPFAPPNVGGWPTNTAWLSPASAQFRLSISSTVINQADLSFLNQIAPKSRVEFLLNHLGVYEWSDRTESALYAARADVKRLYLLAVNSPEYVVSA